MSLHTNWSHVNHTPQFSHTPPQYPIIFGGAKQVDEAALTKTKQALKWLEGFIGDRGFVAGTSLTVADVALVTTVSTLEVRGEELCGSLVYHRVHTRGERSCVVVWCTTVSTLEL